MHRTLLHGLMRPCMIKNPVRAAPPTESHPVTCTHSAFLLKSLTGLWDRYSNVVRQCGHESQPPPPMRPLMQQAQPQKHASIYDLATRLPIPACRDTQALHRIFSFKQGHAQCRVSPELSSKYGEPAALRLTRLLHAGQYLKEEPV